jgi:hypothetical protein
MKIRGLCTSLWLVVVVLLANCAAFAAAPKVEATGPPASLSDALKQAVAAKGWRITLDDGWIAEFWFTKQLKTEKKDLPGALYPELSNSEFVGVVRFPQGMSDYRGQSLPAGTYTLRYQLLPQDGNHMGVSPNPDFLLASPAADDTRPEQAYVERKMVALSAKSTGTGHPAVIALESAGKAGTVAKEENGNVIFGVDVPTEDGGTLKLGIVVKGAATQ